MTEENILSVKELEFEWNNITTIKGIENFTSLNFHSNNISDISQLSNLTNLNTLILSGNQISEISALNNLNKLNYCSLSNNTSNIEISGENYKYKLPNMFLLREIKNLECENCKISEDYIILNSGLKKGEKASITIKEVADDAKILEY